MPDWIHTLDGGVINLHRPDSDVIHTATLAIVLSRTFRFGGHSIEPYSVAQHSVIVSYLVPPELALAGLLHDGHEIYTGMGDLQRPAKDTMRYIAREAIAIKEELTDIAIARHFGFSPVLFGHPDVKVADDIALATERRDVMPQSDADWELTQQPLEQRILPLPMEAACAGFAARLGELCDLDPNLPEMNALVKCLRGSPPDDLFCCSCEYSFNVAIDAADVRGCPRCQTGKWCRPVVTNTPRSRANCAGLSSIPQMKVVT